MRNLQLSLNQTQKIRLQTALEKLESFSSKSNSNSCVTVADSIHIYENGILKGHGTSDRKGELVATVCGVVERINKLIYVRTLRSRYKPETGDIVIGRVIEVAPKRWKLEINFQQDAILMLSSMNLPDGIQRRRTAVDELNMRSIFTENDLVCAEVRSSQNDGSLQLQARNQKYGKLEKGQMLKIDPYLVKRRKQHFHHLEEYGVDLILGCNGFIWVGEHVETRDKIVADQLNDSEQPAKKSDGITTDLDEQVENQTPPETRQNICRIANAIRVLSTLGFNITLEVIMETVNLSKTMNLDVHEMLGSEFYVLVAEKEAERRSSFSKRKR
ncbi:exosome complex component RRP4 homolog isoform X1 [Mangifera indica]|uniref:exosome complex component RRP4 homolog isoform X1 n=1 Tax=Mangifera indica TaxID=29780 RepID=UPI001CF9B71D|nr:exosome complex component RRP4 homolog isoform X1 [Mangifera indica]XP_044494539.1 exosome complex component RRP4 homolog isoform X1 [Mangifera indica]XP_044494547.1 exosome complex component RRP4 homolog isoform X1 [Mangifera indica]XP_044494553.1 exosome complex component RRP4 homolog isoform X1 [Mangifera indica]